MVDSTFTGDLLGTIGLLSTTYKLVSDNRPGNNRVQNKQFEQATRSAGYNPKDSKVREMLDEIHQHIRKKS